MSDKKPAMTIYFPAEISALLEQSILLTRYVSNTINSLREQNVDSAEYQFHMARLQLKKLNEDFLILNRKAKELSDGLSQQGD